MMYPTIHLNGTSKRDLEEQLQEAHGAVRVAIQKLADAAPNGRDYYPQGPDAVYKAQDEHRARIKKLLDVQQELERHGRRHRVRVSKAAAPSREPVCVRGHALAVINGTIHDAGDISGPRCRVRRVWKITPPEPVAPVLSQEDINALWERVNKIKF